MGRDRVRKYESQSEYCTSGMHPEGQAVSQRKDGRGWKMMEDDGRGWKRMEDDGRGWKRMEEDGR